MRHKVVNVASQLKTCYMQLDAHAAHTLMTYAPSLSSYVS